MGQSDVLLRGELGHQTPGLGFSEDLSCDDTIASVVTGFKDKFSSFRTDKPGFGVRKHNKGERKKKNTFYEHVLFILLGNLDNIMWSLRTYIHTQREETMHLDGKRRTKTELKGSEQIHQTKH